MSHMTAEVVTAAQSGDQSAFEALYNEGKNNVYYLGLKMLKSQDDAEDLVQEVFVTVYQKIGTLQNPAAYFGWIKQIAANLCKNKLVKKGAVLFSPADEEADVPEEAEFSEEFLPEKAAENRHLAESVMRLINALPEEQRMVVLLFYYQQMKTREIAEALGVSENTVKSRLSYARRTLKSGAEDEERKGNKLYGFSPALLFMLLGKDAAASAASLPLGWSGIQTAAAGSATGSQSAAATAARAAVTAAAKKAGLSLTAKIAIGIAAVTTFVAGGFAAASLINQPQRPPAEERPSSETSAEEVPEDVSSDTAAVPFDIAGTAWAEDTENERKSAITFYDNGMFLLMINYEENGWFDFPGYIPVYGNYTVSDNPSESGSHKINCKLDRSIFRETAFTEFSMDADAAAGTLTIGSDFPLDVMAGGVAFSRSDDRKPEPISKDADICDGTWLHNGDYADSWVPNEAATPSLTFYANGDFCITNVYTEFLDTYYGTYRREDNSIVCTIHTLVTHSLPDYGADAPKIEYGIYPLEGGNRDAFLESYGSDTFTVALDPAENTLTFISGMPEPDWAMGAIAEGAVFQYTEKHFRYAV